MISGLISALKDQFPAGREGRKSKKFFKVPPDMRQANDKDYNHIFFTFGPYHAKLSAPLSPCDHFKLQAAKALLGDSEDRFQHLVAQIRDRVDPDIRDLYAEPWDHSIDEAEALAHLLALDALTIVAATISITEIFHPHTIGSAVLRDALLLEHQLPLFVLQYAINEVCSGNLTLEDVVKHYVTEGSYPFDSSRASFNSPSSDPNSELLLTPMIGLIYDSLTSSTSDDPASNDQRSIGCCSSGCSFLPGQRQLPTASELRRCGSFLPGQRQLPTASELRRCGIKLKFENPRDLGSAIRFDERNRALILPRITVHDGTPSCLLNLAAYEVATRSFGPRPVCFYIKIMNSLVDKEEDVKLLVKAGVIENQLGSHKQLASIWNSMATYLSLSTTDENDVHNIIEKVNKACKSKWHKWIVGFLDTYWDKKPWLLISMAAAFCLLVLTLLITIYTMKQYFPR